MSVLSTDIKFYGSGVNNLGGAISATEITSNTLHNLFDAVRAAEALAGMTDYRCIYVKNEATGTDPDSTLTDPVMFLETAPGSPSVAITFGLGTAAVSGTEPINTSGENAAPSGVSFTAAPDAISGLDMATLLTGEYQAIWLKRTVAATADAVANDTFTVTVLGETV